MKRTETGYVHGNWQGSLGAGLSPREVQSMLLIADGKTYKEAAMVLGVAHCTFADRISNVLYKLKVARGPQAVAEAIRRGIIAPMMIALVTLSGALAHDVDMRRNPRPRARSKWEQHQPLTIV